MAYILAVNPSILADAGMDRAALVTVTALSAATATAMMALLTNYPLALAPGMGINAFFTYTICIGAGVPWQQALGMVFVNGCVFLLLSVSGVRERVVRAIPYSLTLAITGGIGLFIAFIGLRNGGVVVASPATFVTHGDFSQRPDRAVPGGPGAHRRPGGAARARRDRARRRVDDARRRVRARRARRHGHRVAGALVSMPASPAPRGAAAGPVVPDHAGRLPARAAAHPDAAAGGHVRQHRHADGRRPSAPAFWTRTASCRAWAACWWPTRWRRS